MGNCSNYNYNGVLGDGQNDSIRTNRRTNARKENKMNTVGWKIVYESGQEVRIGNMLKGLYEEKDWKELHIALWTWLSIDGERDKWKWFEQYGVPRVSNDCFACEEAKSHLVGIQSGGSCYYCPLTKSTAIGCLGGVYDQWRKADFETRKYLAEKIANMKWLY